MSDALKVHGQLNGFQFVDYMDRLGYDVRGNYLMQESMQSVIHQMALKIAEQETRLRVLEQRQNPARHNNVDKGSNDVNSL